MRDRTNSFYAKKLKRALDFIISIMVVIFFWWIYLICAILIVVDSGFPIIFKQIRIGQNGKEFEIYKFRTMVKNAQQIGPTSTAANDSRITKIGKVLRKTSLDELPQIINILQGDMSFVGYRPDVPRSDVDYTSDVYLLKPGITGYAQTEGRSSLTIDEKRDWEKRYTRDVSFVTDVKIIIKTIGVVFNRKDSN